MREVHTQIFTFKYNNQFYRFERPFIVGIHNLDTFRWLKSCCKEIGANPKKTTHRAMTFAHWNFTVGIIF